VRDNKKKNKIHAINQAMALCFLEHRRKKYLRPAQSNIFNRPKDLFVNKDEFADLISPHQSLDKLKLLSISFDIYC
jgi:hypothetical protein